MCLCLCVKDQNFPTYSGLWKVIASELDCFCFVFFLVINLTDEDHLFT